MVAGVSGGKKKACRHFADDLRGTQARAGTFAEPEWKEKALGKAVMFGYQARPPSPCCAARYP